MPGRIAENVAESLRGGDGFRHGGEKGVAGAEGNHECPRAGGSHADKRRWIVSGGEGDLAITREAVLLDEVGGNRASDRGRCGRAGKLVAEVWCGGLEEVGIPFEGVEVEQVHAGAVAMVDVDGFSGQDLPQEHGALLRALVPDRYFYKSVKWLQRIKFSAVDEPGFYEKNGYSNSADPWK